MRENNEDEPTADTVYALRRREESPSTDTALAPLISYGFLMALGAFFWTTGGLAAA